MQCLTSTSTASLRSMSPLYSCASIYPSCSCLHLHHVHYVFVSSDPIIIFLVHIVNSYLLLAGWPITQKKNHEYLHKMASNLEYSHSIKKRQFKYLLFNNWKGRPEDLKTEIFHYINMMHGAMISLREASRIDYLNSDIHPSAYD